MQFAAVVAVLVLVVVVPPLFGPDGGRFEVRNCAANSRSAASPPSPPRPFPNAPTNDLSQIPNNARPCATDALLPTVHTTAASSASSRAAKHANDGSRCAARTKGSVAEAYEEMESGRKEGAKEAGRRKTDFWWAR